MKKTLLSILSFILIIQGYSQLQKPISYGDGLSPTWTQTKAPGDSCGIYYNNYIGLTKTSAVFFEEMRTGDGSDFNPYPGRGQRFHAPQPIEVYGIQFYSYETNPAVDSLMAITVLYDYDSSNDSVGVEFARDTVYVKHQAFSINLMDISVQSVFDNPVTVTQDYIIAVYTPTNDSLKIITSSAPANDGAGEGVSFAYYDNPAAPSFTGWYSTLPTFGASYDLDYLIDPFVKYDLNDGFTVLDDTICPEMVSAGCVNYSQFPIYSDPHYNGFANTPTDNIQWLWGDGFQNTNIVTACHTYNNPGDYTITLRDTLYRYDVNSNICVGISTEMIHVKDTVVADFTFVTGGIIVDFTSTALNADSLAWDFGDGNTGGDSITIQHNYDSLGTFDVWLYAYNECGVDSIMMQVTTDDVGVENYDFAFKMYPNPANEQVFVTGLVEGAQIDLINILGESIKTTVATQNNVAIAFDELSNGTYFVRVSTEYGYVTKKLIVRK